MAELLAITAAVWALAYGIAIAVTRHRHPLKEWRRGDWVRVNAGAISVLILSGLAVLGIAQ